MFHCEKPEKLSSGYKINRAGDDAAGLAISEKMRAQITGLNAAQKNVKDGISLVKTAEGAMQEIQDMLNRMDYLATQSANGTYDDPVDRANLQKEVDALKTEINRIADSANFNGIKLLDGSLAGKSQVSNLAMDKSAAVKGVYSTGTSTATQDISGLKASDIGKNLEYKFNWKDEQGNDQTTTVKLTFKGAGDGTVSSAATKNYLEDVNGNKYYLQADGTLAATQVGAAIEASLKADEKFSNAFDIKQGANGFEFTARTEGSKGAVLTGVGAAADGMSMDRTQIFGDLGDNTLGDDIKVVKKPLDSMQKFDASKLQVGVATDSADDLAKKIFEIDGHKFLLSHDMTPDQLQGVGSDVTIIEEIAGTTVAAGDVAHIAAEISRVTGLKAETFAAANTDANITTTDIVFTEDKLNISGKALTLQIGDTADTFNQMDVKVGDMHTDALGITDVDISNQEGAAAAIQVIKDAINNVSSVRGDLGAVQNRLEHTQKNLSVMAENIQDAESTIRDTDVAEEMMSYTKNNILIQSAQAMLAQANAVPQGVLQLLG
ncbi:flagellin [uncultured Oscillibacter sp.]|uniref:flagellin N-terminal helical domain-containing protein n=1 Tax=uncultured Oscillibacter sp. TaxID=876091 RepID=UPI00272ADC4F|nr:flagellin [uncultured Oscillibacter sp.]